MQLKGPVGEHKLQIGLYGYAETLMNFGGELYRMLKKRFESGTPEDRIAVAQALRAGLAALGDRADGN